MHIRALEIQKHFKTLPKKIRKNQKPRKENIYLLLTVQLWMDEMLLDECQNKYLKPTTTNEHVLDKFNRMKQLKIYILDYS